MKEYLVMGAMLTYGISKWNTYLWNNYLWNTY